MPNGRTIAEQLSYKQRARERQFMGPELLRRRASALVVIGLAFVFMGGLNLDLFEATVGCIAVASGGAWRWCLWAFR
jgi:hypothetical protein